MSRQTCDPPKLLHPYKLLDLFFVVPEPVDFVRGLLDLCFKFEDFLVGTPQEFSLSLECRLIAGVLIDCIEQ